MQPPGEGARALLSRVSSQPQQLPQSLFELRGNASQEARLSNSYATLHRHDQRFDQARGRADLGPNRLHRRRRVPARVRRTRHPRDAQRKVSTAQRPTRSSSSSALWTSRASTRPSAQESELRLLVTLGRDQRVDTMPDDVEVPHELVGTILGTNKPLIDSKLEQLVGTPVARPRDERSARRRKICTRPRSRASSKRG